jgi:RHS repeat-associated protein
VPWHPNAQWDTTQRYVLDGWNPVQPTPIGNENWDVLLDLNGSNGLETRYLRGDGVDELFARVDSITTPAAYWTLLDHQGSIRDVIDESGDLVASVRYDAYGNVTEHYTGVGDPLPEEDFGYLGRFGWTGRERDAETGLQYNRARYYDPRTARWFSQDPIGFAAGDANLYRYVGNAPTVATDPSGLAEDPLPGSPEWLHGLGKQPPLATGSIGTFNGQTYAAAGATAAAMARALFLHVGQDLLMHYAGGKAGEFTAFLAKRGITVVRNNFIKNGRAIGCAARFWQRMRLRCRGRQGG